MDRILLSVIMAVCLIGFTDARESAGSCGSIYLGTGSPNSISAVRSLANNLGIQDATGNYVAGIQGFHQDNRYRIGGIIQGHVWGSINLGEDEDGDDAVGVVAVVGGLQAGYTFRHERILLNVGTMAGAGRCFLGYHMGKTDEGRNVNVSTFYVEPQVSLGLVTCRWFGVEFQLSMPIFLLTENLTLSEDQKNFTVTGRDLGGVNFSIKLNLGKFADF